MSEIRKTEDSINKTKSIRLILTEHTLRALQSIETNVYAICRPVENGYIICTGDSSKIPVTRHIPLIVHGTRPEHTEIIGGDEGRTRTGRDPSGMNLCKDQVSRLSAYVISKFYRKMLQAFLAATVPPLPDAKLPDIEGGTQINLSDNR